MGRDQYGLELFDSDTYDGFASNARIQNSKAFTQAFRKTQSIFHHNSKETIT
jgi:hypothetical protein